MLSAVASAQCDLSIPAGQLGNLAEWQASGHVNVPSIMINRAAVGHLSAQGDLRAGKLAGRADGQLLGGTLHAQAAEDVGQDGAERAGLLELSGLEVGRWHARSRAVVRCRAQRLGSIFVCR